MKVHTCFWVNRLFQSVRPTTEAIDRSNDETTCEYVSSRGLLKSCDCRSVVPVSSQKRVETTAFSGLDDGDMVYVCSSALRDFADKWLRKIDKRVILLSGDSDTPVPTGALSDAAFKALVECDKVIAWFSQNLVLSPKRHPKLRHLPIGLDYHTLSEKSLYWGPVASPRAQEELLMGVARNADPFFDRIPKAYTTFHFELSRGGRRLAYEHIPSELVSYEPARVSRLTSWENQSRYAFVVSPPGEGLDCHRTWEALSLGCIPILISTPLDDMYEGLPVLIVKSWADLSRELLDSTLREYKTRKFSMEKMKLQYWLDAIRSCYPKR